MKHLDRIKGLKGLKNTLEYLNKKIQGKEFKLKRSQQIIFDIINRNESALTKFQNNIKIRYNEFKSKNKETFFPNSYSEFFYRNFDELFKTFFSKFFNLNFHSLELNTKDKLSPKLLLLEYTYHLSNEESRLFQNYRKILNLKEKGLFFHITYLYLIINSLNIISRSIIPQGFKIALEGAILEQTECKNNVHFLIIIKSERKCLYNNYFQMALFYFLKQFKGLPKHIFKKMKKGRNALFKLALEEYSMYEMREQLIELLYFFYKKCSLTKSVRPLLDLFNFICSRVEDSIFSKLDVINEKYLNNFDYDIKTKNFLIETFRFLDRSSTLSSTFLANNLPSVKSQLDLFLLYIKYYLGMGLETLECGDLLFIPKIFINKLNTYNSTSNSFIINSNSIITINQFLQYLLELNDIENIDFFFKKIFKKSVSMLNFEFFQTFFRSLNKKVHLIVEGEGKISPKTSEKNLTFDFVIAHICRMLYVLIDTIFLYETLEEASKNFIDSRGRYITKNIALRTKELFIFQDMNFSDDLWPEVLLSVNKKKVSEILRENNISIQNKYFYNDEDLTHLLITYNFQYSSQGEILEEWLIDKIIFPCNSFLMSINESISGEANQAEIYEELYRFFSKGVEDETILRDIDIICSTLTSFWNEMGY
jgi:hypothetical protein